MRWRRSGLWTHPDFLKLWAGQTVSLVGTEITRLAFPLTAVVLLHATPAQMGFLGAAQFAPFLLVGFFAGTWVDRWRRRPILLWTNLGQAVLLGSIPAAALLHRLGFRFRLSRKLAVDREEVGRYCLWHDCAGFQNPIAPGRRSGVDRSSDETVVSIPFARSAPTEPEPEIAATSI